MANELDLVATIRADPLDSAAWLIYADWLEEHGQTTLARRIRLHGTRGYDGMFSDLLGVKLLLGRTATGIWSGDQHSASPGLVAQPEWIIFHGVDWAAIMDHRQNCCESVYLEDVCGDWRDLVGAQILSVEEVTSTTPPPGYTVPLYSELDWTFYHLRTVRGTVTMRWVGVSNGHYSTEIGVREHTGDINLVLLVSGQMPIVRRRALGGG